MAMDKLARQQLLRRLLDEHALRSQAHVRELLRAHGVDAHQATVSRDLDELGAVKVRGVDGDLVYRLTSDPGPGQGRTRLDEVLRQFVTSVRSSGNMAVLGTPPACAHPVASAIDLAELPGVLATVAGDDIILVVAEEGILGADLATRFLAKLR